MTDQIEKQKEQAKEVKKSALEKSKDALIQSIEKEGNGSIKVFYMKKMIENNLEAKGDLGALAKSFSSSLDLFTQIAAADPNYKVIVGRSAIPLIRTL